METAVKAGLAAVNAPSVTETSPERKRVGGSIPDGRGSFSENAIAPGEGVGAGNGSVERARMPDPFDALAELFLGEVSLGDAAKESGKPAALPSVRSSEAIKRGPSRQPACDLDSEHVNVIGRRDAAPMTAPSHAVCVEGLVIGHLPVLGSVWAMQYARHVARAEKRPVAMLRVHRGVCTIELIGDATAIQTQDQETSPERKRAGQANPANNPLPDGRGSLIQDNAFALGTTKKSRRERAAAIAGQDVAVVMHTLSKQTTRWMIRLDEPDEPNLASCGDIDAITLLTGSDEMAMASALRTIKKLDRIKAKRESDTGIDRDADSRQFPGLRLVVMGSPPEQAERAAKKLMADAETHTGREITLVACIEKIQSFGTGTPVHRSTILVDSRQLLNQLRHTLDAMNPERERAGPANPPINRLRDDRILSIEDTTFPPRGGTEAEVEAKPEPSVHTAPRRISPAAQSELEATLILAANVPGLRPIAARCPYSPSVGLSLDSGGGVHLLASVHASSAEHAVIQSLLTTDDWLADHFELVRLTLPPGMPLDTTRQVVFHVFIKEGSAVRRLLRQGMRVHLAMPGADDSMLGVARYVEVS